MTPKQPPGPPIPLGNMRRQGVQHLIAFCHNDTCRHQAIIDVSKYQGRGALVSGPHQVREAEMKFIAVAISIMIATLGQSFAQPIESGNDIKESCQFVVEGPKTNLEAAKALYCMGFVRSLLFIGRRLEERDSFCPPEGVHVSQAANIFLKYLNDNPEKTKLPPEDLAIQAFREAWHCQ